MDMKEISIFRRVSSQPDNEPVVFRLKQLNRLSLTVDAISEAQTITSGNEYCKKFDILSVCPGNAKVFAYLCKTAEIDIISIDFSHKISFPLKKKLVSIYFSS